MEEFVIVTNNPLVQEKYRSEFCVEYVEEGIEETLIRIRDKVYAGHRLLTHPLSGSVKPKETPYKSVLVTKKSGVCDAGSVRLIEYAIDACGKFSFRPGKWGAQVLEDFQLIDCTLLESALPSATAWQSAEQRL